MKLYDLQSNMEPDTVSIVQVFNEYIYYILILDPVLED